jgi:hypothetical protein
MQIVSRGTAITAVAVAALTVSAAKLHAQNECQCTAPGADASRIANAIGGGLFAGLIAAVIPFHHARALAAAAPPPGDAPTALTTMSDSTDIAPGDSSKRSPTAAYAAASPREESPSGTAAPRARASNGEAAAPLPSITPEEAVADGMIAPKTATLLPALTMIGIGAIFTGILFIRVRRPRLHSR